MSNATEDTVLRASNGPDRRVNSSAVRRLLARASEGSSHAKWSRGTPQPLDADNGHRAAAVTRSRAIQARRASARSGQMEAKRTRRTCGPTTRDGRVPPIARFRTSRCPPIHVARGWLIRTTSRLRPGRSWHNRRCDRDREITGSSRRDPLDTCSRMRHCQEFPGTQAQPQPACRDPAAALWIGPREATDRHDQHKLTQPARSRRSPQTVLQEQKPQVRDHITGWLPR